MLSRHPSAVLACLLGAFLALTGCGGGTKNASAKKATASATTSTTAGDRRAALAAFRSCMADHGITLPDRGAGGGQGGPSFPQGGPPTSTAPGGGGGAGGGGGRGFRQAPPGVDQAKFQELANNAKAGCPISRLLKADITLEAKLEGARS